MTTSTVTTLTVAHPTGSYPIYLAENMLAQTGQKLAGAGHSGRCAVVTNETVGAYHADVLLEGLRSANFEPTRIDIPDGEQHKTLATVAGLYDDYIAAKLDRRSPVIALGGGVLGDTVGFSAASYLRGVPFVQIPTTLLAMVDASVGGKTGVDLPQGKNLVGAFKQPEMVVVDPQVLKTLPDKEFRAGLAEVIKHGIIDDIELFTALENNDVTINSDGNTDSGVQIAWVLARAIPVKIRVVEEDPFERGRRAVLNLGHTFAHAFEQLANFEMRHGEAVAIGLVCAARLAVHLGHCSEATADRIETVVEQWQLPVTPPKFEVDAVWRAMFNDKKRQGNQIRFILPRDIGDVDIFKTISETDVKLVLSQLGLE